LDSLPELVDDFLRSKFFFPNVTWLVNVFMKWMNSLGQQQVAQEVASLGWNITKESCLHQVNI